MQKQTSFSSVLLENFIPDIYSFRILDRKKENGARSRLQGVWFYSWERKSAEKSELHIILNRGPYHEEAEITKITQHLFNIITRDIYTQFMELQICVVLTPVTINSNNSGTQWRYSSQQIECQCFQCIISLLVSGYQGEFILLLSLLHKQSVHILFQKL